MKNSKKRLFLGAAIAFFVALFLGARNAASWRPQLIGKVGQNARHALIFSPNGRFAILGFSEIWDFSGSHPRRLRNLGDGSFYGFADEKSYWSAQISWRPPIERGLIETQVSRRSLASRNTIWSFPLLKISGDNPIQFLNFSGDKKQLVVTRHKNAEVWDVASKRKLKNWNWPIYMDALTGAKNASIFLTMGEEIILYDLPKQRILWQKPLRKRQFFGDFEIAPAEKTLWVLSGKPNSAQFLDASTGKLLWTRNLSWTDTVPPLQFSADGKHVYVAHWSGVEILDARSGRKIISRKLPKSSQSFVFALSPDENWLYTVEKNGDLKRWRMQ